MDVDVVRTTPITEPMAQLNIGANFKLVPPPDGPARGHLDARDPCSGREEVGGQFRRATACRRAGDGRQSGVRAPDSRGVLHAYNAETGAELWSHYNGVGHNGIISYSASGESNISRCRPDEAAWWPTSSGAVRRTLQEHAERRRCARRLYAEATMKMGRRQGALAPRLQSTDVKINPSSSSALPWHCLSLSARAAKPGSRSGSIGQGERHRGQANVSLPRAASATRAAVVQPAEAKLAGDAITIFLPERIRKGKPGAMPRFRPCLL